MNEDLDLLSTRLTALIWRRRQETLNAFARVNSPVDDLLDWSQVAQAWHGAAEGVTIYPSASLAGEVSIGRNTWVGPNCILDGSGGLHIGEYCSIGSGAQIFTHDTVRWALSGGVASTERSPVSVGDRCFIGSYSTVLRGVSIGQMSVVAAGAVVTRDCPERSVIAGVPAVRIGEVQGDGDEVSLRYL